MSPSVKKAVSKVVSKSVPQNGEGDALVDPRDTAKYLLRVTAGPSYDDSTHAVVEVNGKTIEVENEHMIAKIKVRIQEYHGKEIELSPSSA